MSKILYWFFIFLLSFNVNSSEKKHPLSTSSFSKSYKVKARGLSAGKASFSMNVSDKGYTASLKLNPNFMAKSFGISVMTEKVVGNIIKRNLKSELVPKEYKRVSDSEIMFLAKFDSKNIVITDNEKNYKVTVKNNNLAQDPLTQIVQIRQDLIESKLSKRYVLVTGKKIRNYIASLKKTKNQYIVTLTQEKTAKRILNFTFNKSFHLLEMKKIRKGTVDFWLK